MNERERLRETLLFGNSDKIPFDPGEPRESTLQVWHRQGLPQGADWRDYLMHVLDIPCGPTRPHVDLGVSFGMLPHLEKVLEHRDGHCIVQDWTGAIAEIADQYDFSYLRQAKDFVMPKWHRFPVQSCADWEEKSNGDTIRATLNVSPPISKRAAAHARARGGRRDDARGGAMCRAAHRRGRLYSRLRSWRPARRVVAQLCRRHAPAHAVDGLVVKGAEEH